MRKPLEVLWLKDQFDELHKEHALILKRIDELEKKLDKVPVMVTPGLEAAVKAVAVSAVAIDRKVPDQ